MTDQAKVRTASLKPSHAVAEYGERGISGVPELLPRLRGNLREAIQKYYGTSRDDSADLNIRNCLLLIIRNVRHLSQLYNVHQSRVVGAALHLGIRFLWAACHDDIQKIEEARSFIYRNAPHDIDSVRWFEWNTFDLGSSEMDRYHNQCRKEDVSQCNKLAQILGLKRPLIYQLSIMVGLMTDNNIPAEYNQDMAAKLTEFIRSVKRRARGAERVAHECREESGTKLVGPRKSLQDVIDASKDEV